MTPPSRRVVITGMGCMTAAGAGAEALWQSARDGVSGVKAIEIGRAPNVKVKLAAALPDFDIRAHFDEKRGTLDRFAAMAILAADQAVAQSRLVTAELGSRCGVIVGSALGGAETIDQLAHSFYVSGARLDPMGIPKLMPSAAASQISIRYRAEGPSFCVSSACASGAQAIGIAASLIRSGVIEAAIAGGAEALLNGLSMRAWEVLHVLTPTKCRPFSKGRDGMVLGEGAAMFVLESLQSAQARDAPIIAELAGYGTSSDAVDLLRPDSKGAARAMASAIGDAGLLPSDIHYVNAHGTGTIANDASESQALSSVFGSSLKTLPVSSTKPVHGHTLGAAGAVELVVTLKALSEQQVPPTLNWLGTDPHCDLDAVPNNSRPHRIAAAMSNSFAFGGINTSLVVRHPADLS